MARLQLKLPGVSAALLLSALCSPVHARTAGESCAVVGMFDARAKALCEAALRSAPAQAPAAPPPYQQGPPGYQGPGGPAGYPSQRAPAPPPPVRDGFTRVNIVGNLYVDVQGAYPPGYSGKWSGVGAPTTVPVSQTWYVNRGEAKSTTQQSAFLVAPDGSVRAQFGFGIRNGSCYGDITGTDGPVLLSEAPQTFRISNLHLMTPNYVSGCAFTNTVNNFSGSVTLSADSKGNVYAQYNINVFNAQGTQQYLWESSSYQLRNTMTPELAVADIARKKELAAQQAVAEAAAIKARAAADERRRVRLARKLTPLEARIDKIIQQDSGAWLSNRYDVNSVTDAKMTTATKAIAEKDGVPVGAQALQADFTLNDGRPASVDVIVIKGAIKCVQFSDESVCRALGHPQSHAVLAGALASAMADSGSSGSGQDENTRFNMYRQNNINQGRNDNGTQK